MPIPNTSGANRVRPMLERLEDRSLLSADLGWAFALGATGVDSTRDIVADTSGNVIVSGKVNGAVDFDPGPGTTTLGPGNYLAKYSADGALVWAQLTSLPGTKDALTLDGGDNIYLHTRNSANTQHFITKYGPTGDLLQTFSVGSHDVSAVSFDSGGNLYYTTRTQYPSTAPAYVVKLNGSTGSQVWSRQLTPKGSSAVRGLAIGLDAANNIYVSGSFDGTVDFDPGPGKFELKSPPKSGLIVGNGFILKLNSAGNFAWAGSMGTDDPAGTSASYLAVEPSGNVYITGAWTPGNSRNDFDPGPATLRLTSAGDRDIFILKLDTNRNLQWATSIGSLADPGSDGDFTSGIALDGAGGVYFTGKFYNTVDFDPGPGVFNLVGTPSGNSSDMFVLKLNTAGAFGWAVSSSGDLGDTSTDIAVTPTGDVYTVGRFDGITDFDPSSGVYTLTNVDYNPDPGASHPDDGFVWKLTQAESAPQGVAARNTNPGWAKATRLPPDSTAERTLLDARLGPSPGGGLDLVATSLVLERLARRRS